MIVLSVFRVRFCDKPKNPQDIRIDEDTVFDVVAHTPMQALIRAKSLIPRGCMAIDVTWLCSLDAR
jgi:hypothetical protein